MKNFAKMKRAIALRRLGESLSSISKKIDVAKSTCSIWLRNVKLNQRAKNRINKKCELSRTRGVETNRKRRERLLTDLDLRIVSRLNKVKDSIDLKKMMCAILYWCEGEKNCSAIVFCNSDPVLLRFFLDLLRSSFKIKESKLRVCLHLHSYHNEKKQINYWSKSLKIDSKLFYKVYWKQNSGKRRKKDYPGCASVRYYDSKIALELSREWALLSKKFGRVG